MTEAAIVRLALVTCGPQLEVALEAASSRVVSMIRLGGVAPRSTLVLAAVDLLVEDAGLTGDSVDEVVVSRGPGSFTGIRAGLATAAGIGCRGRREVSGLRFAADAGRAVSGP